MSNELTVRENFLATEMDQAFMDEMQEQMQGVSMMFPRAKVAAGGLTVFEVGDDETAKSLKGVIVEQHTVNVYWQSKDIVTGAQPDCYSPDGIVGICAEGVTGPTGNCANCPLNQFGSAEGGRGKACSNKVRLYILLDGQQVPTQLDIPASSIKPFNQYMSWLRNHMYLPSSVVTEITLTKQQMGNNTVAVCVFKCAEKLAPEAAKSAMQYARSMRKQTRSHSFQEAADTYTPFDA